MAESRIRYKTFGDKHVFLCRRSQKDTPVLTDGFAKWMNLTFGDSWRIEFAFEAVGYD